MRGFVISCCNVCGFLYPQSGPGILPCSDNMKVNAGTSLRLYPKTRPSQAMPQNIE